MDRLPSLIRQLPRRRVGPQESGKNHEARPFSISEVLLAISARITLLIHFFLTNSTVSCLTGSRNGEEQSAREESETRGERAS